MKLPEHIAKAIRCGPVPKTRNWRRIKRFESLTKAERIMHFAETYLTVTEGKLQGNPLKLDLFQQVFLYSVFDNPAGTRLAILSMARKNGKTALCAIIVLYFLVSSDADAFSQISSAAMSRDQAALVFNHIQKFIDSQRLVNPKNNVHLVDPKTFEPLRVLQDLVKVTPSGKQIRGKNKHVQYKALAKDAGTVVGRSDKIIIGDEFGQIVGPSDDFVTAVMTGQGAFDDPLLIVISTQAPSDADLLSVWIDDAEKSKDKHTVCHVYEAEKDCNLMDEKQWKFANPALHVFRSKVDLKEQLKKASRLPALESDVRNYMLNQRVSKNSLWLSKSVWNRGSGEIDLDVFMNNEVSIGLDLSARIDLTAAVCAAQCPETGIVHLLPFVFCPLEGIRERSRRDRAPYDVWIKQGFLIGLQGSSVDYDEMIIELKSRLDDLEIEIQTIEFDRWRMDIFQAAADRQSFAYNAELNPVGQGFKDMSPRCENFINLLMAERIRHGDHPLLTAAASNAIAVFDPAGSIKLDKSKSTQRIDPLVSAVMAAFPVSEGQLDQETAKDVELWIA